MKQLGLAFQQYCQDFDEKMPSGSAGTGGDGYFSTTGEGWAGQIYPNVRNTQLYICPSDTTKNPAPPLYRISYAYNHNCAMPVNGVFPPAYLGVPLSAFNDGTRTILLVEARDSPVNVGALYQVRITDIDEGGYSVGVKSAQTDGAELVSLSGSSESTKASWNGPAQCMTGWMADLGASTCSILHHSWNFGTGDPNSGAGGDVGRHLVGSNVLFMDGHVKWLLGRSIATGSNAAKASDDEATNQRVAAGTASTNSRWQATFSVR